MGHFIIPINTEDNKMARLASDAKFGFYPTPESVIKIISNHVQMKNKSIFFDPCCGDSNHIEILKKQHDAIYYGIELEQSRFNQSKQIMDECIHANAIMDIEVKKAFADVLFLNPPYGIIQNNGDSGRLELLFLKKYIKTLKSNGILIFIVKLDLFNYQSIKEILKTFYDISIFRFGNDCYDDFNQVVFFGKKKTHNEHQKNESYISQTYQDIYLDRSNSIEFMDKSYNASQSYQIMSLPRYLNNHKVTNPERYQKIALKNTEDFINIKVNHRKKIQPITQVRPGHLGMLMASGMMNGKCVKDNFGNILLIKGALKQGVQIIEEEDENNIITKTIKFTKPVISCFNLHNLEFKMFE